MWIKWYKYLVTFFQHKLQTFFITGIEIPLLGPMKCFYT
jgi:hypothetical protein